MQTTMLYPSAMGTGKPCPGSSRVVVVLPRIRSSKHIRRVASDASGSSEDGASSAIYLSRRWDEITDRLVGSASIPFSVLVLPQVLQNFSNISSGNPAALAAISWESWLSGLLGNTLMCGHFSGTGERSAVNVQLLGMANNMVVLSQLVYVGAMPTAVFAATAVGTGIAAAMGLAKLRGAMPEAPSASGQPSGFTMWQTWQLMIGLAGLAVVPQVMYNILVPSNPSFLPGLVTAITLITLFAGKFNSAESQHDSGGMVEKLPGWAATLLFALQPLPQLVKNFVDSSGLEGLSLGTLMLALLGNALMIPRAMYIRDRVWFVGTHWACLAGWGQVLSLHLGVSAVTGVRYLSQGPFLAITALMLTYWVFISRVDAKAKGVSSVPVEVGRILAGQPYV